VGGDASLVMLVGEAGIGKTALAERIAAEAERDGGTVLRTRCYEAERSLFLQPLTEAARSVAGRLPAAELRRLLGEHGPALAVLMPEFAALLGPAPSWHGSPDAERRRSFEAVAALLTGLAARDPVLLVVDDLQYAGQSTAEFIHYLGRHLSGTRLLMVVIIRAEHVQEAGALIAPLAATIEVGPLSPEAVAQLAAEAGQGRLADSIVRRTRGHTLFVMEVLRALAAGSPAYPNRCAARSRHGSGGSVRRPRHCCAPDLCSAPRSIRWSSASCSTWHRPPRSSCARWRSRPGCSRSAGAVDEQALAAGLDGLKISCLNVGDLRGFAEVLAELIPLLRRLGDLFRLQWAEFESAFLFIASADWDKAVAAMENGIAAAATRTSGRGT
jgi:hypothetical protein